MFFQQIYFYFPIHHHIIKLTTIANGKTNFGFIFLITFNILNIIDKNLLRKFFKNKELRIRNKEWE